MNRDSCQTLEELLVDFADDALTGAEAARVREHVAQCPHCRATVEALRQSLECAQTIWQDNARHVGRARAPRSRKWHYVAAAASILLAVGALTYWPSRPQSAPSAPTLTEIENRIAASGRAARLLARVDQLETQASLQEVAASQYRYIAERYPDTTAAAAARLKLESLR
jgi:anti-sigma factor RsiW